MEGRKTRRLKHYANAVSKAHWPANVRKRTATGRLAQRRRLLIMKGIWPTPVIKRRTVPGGMRMLSAYITRARIARIVFALATGTLVLLLCMLYDWSGWLILAGICAMTIFMVTRPAVHAVGEHEKVLPQASRILAQQGQVQQIVGEVQQTPLLFPFPDTPMPATPLVRVLETIDLSSTNVEHFLDIKNQAPPRSTEVQQERGADQPMHD